MKTTRKIICLLMALTMALAGPISIFAQDEAMEPLPADGPNPEGVTGFPLTGAEASGNTTDSSKLPRREAPTELTDYYGIVENEGAETVESLISAEALDDFSAAINMAADFEPVSDDDVSKVLGSVNSFISSGKLDAYLQSGDLLLGAEFGLVRNKTEKVKVLGSDTNASSWVFVVDKDAMSWWVRDKDGMGIPDALVTISYLDASGKRVTQSTPTTRGNTPGIAAFDNIPENFFGIIDIQAQGYRSVTILDRDMGKGYHETIELEEAGENEVYIRGVDLSGKDMVNEETKLVLCDMDTGDLDLKVLVTKTGSAQFPETIEINADNRGKTVLSLNQSSSYELDPNTRVYSAKKRWAEQSAGLFKEDDKVSIGLGSTSVALQHLTVENSVSKPGSGETEAPITQRNLDGDTEDMLSGGGWLNQTMQIFAIPVSFGVFPDGTFILMASYDFSRLAPNIQSKFSSLFADSWKPKDFKNLDKPLEIFQKSFWENTEKVKKGQEILESPNKIKHVLNKSYDFSMNFSLFLRSNHNKETNDNYGTGGILFSAAVTAGLTEYFLIPAGPIVIPFYIGFEGHLKINTQLAINFAMKTPPTGHDQDKEWKYAAGDGTDVSARIEVITGFSVFGGVGVKGVLGGAAVGYVDFDIATVLAKGEANAFTDPPHSFIDILYGLRFEYYLLFYSGVINMDCAKDAKRLDDSTWKKAELQKLLLDSIEFKPMDMSEFEEGLIPALTDDGKDHDDFFLRPGETVGSDAGTAALEAGEGVEGQSRIIDVDASVLPDSQLQFVSTADYTALVRLGYNGARTDIYYQLQNPDTGNLWSGLYRVRLPEEETRSVSEYVVVANKTEAGSNKIYIGAVVVDDTLTNEEARLRSTDVYAIVVDLDKEQTVSAVLASDQSRKGEYLYSAPKPAGSGDVCSVAYAATYIKECVDSDGKISLKCALGASLSYTSWYISWGEEGHPENRSFRNIGDSKVQSTGVIVSDEPTYWVVDNLKSSDKYIYARGYGANGSYEETLKCNVRVDIDGMIATEDVRKGIIKHDSMITNWQYMNGCSYFVVGSNVYWMKKVPTSSGYEWSAEKVENGSGVINADNSYAMITNNNNSAVYLIGVVGDYETDFETGKSEKGYNIAKIYTITTDKDASGKLATKLHGPLDIRFACGDEVRTFAAAYNPDECEASGLTIVYSTKPSNPDRYAEKIRMWLQSADRGLLVTDVRIPDYLVLSDQKAIELFVTVRNYGYGVENSVPYQIVDENGTVLMLTNGKNDYYPSSYFFSGEDMYTGDSRVDRMLIRPNPSWTINKEHEIKVTVTGGYEYNGFIEDVVNTAPVASDNMTLTAENILIGGKHYISTSFENNTFIGEETPMVKIVLDYAEDQSSETQTGSADRPILLASLGVRDVGAASKPEQLKFSLPTDEMIVQFDTEDEALTGQIYHFDIDMDSVWQEGLEKGLRGVYVSLVGKDGTQQSNEAIYLVNPAEKRPDTVRGKKLDENGDPLEGATIGLFAEGNDEPAATAVSDAEGAFSFTIYDAGEYIVKETEAPEGYALNETEYPVSAVCKGEIYEIEITNEPVKGGVKISLTDADDASKMLSGAKFAVYDKDGNKVGELTETSPGVYELSGLPYGEYTVRLEGAPEGYTAEFSGSVSISEDGKTVESKVTAEAEAVPEPDTPDEPDESPKTGDDNSLWIYGGICVAALAAIGGILISGKKKKKE